jgi:hypothetical protein
MNRCLEKAFELKQNKILLGDTKDDQFNFSNHILLLKSMTNFINALSRITSSTQTLLDPIAVTNNIFVFDSDIFETPKEVSDQMIYDQICNAFLQQ